MNQPIFHSVSLADSRFLVTGGAGFIGSNLVEYLLSHNVGHVRVLDNLSNGYFENIKPFLDLPNFEFIEGDIRDIETCRKAAADVHYISHQAALGSVPRSIQDPITTNAVNIDGFLNMLVAAKESTTLKRFVYAASSSTYGDSPLLPKVEGNEGKPLSPYAITKAVNEHYGDVFSNVYGFHTIGLRYFNIFGPRQSPDNPYAAVIPIFAKAFIDGKSPTIHGDGITSRDFTYVENAIQANIKAMLADKIAMHKVFNVACGEQTSLNDMVAMLGEISGIKMSANYGPERAGDVKHSKASIEKIKTELGYQPNVLFREGLEKVYAWYQSYFAHGS
jgi:UDP-N-acetylglucosamine 4-epimerase